MCELIYFSVQKSMYPPQILVTCTKVLWSNRFFFLPGNTGTVVGPLGLLARTKINILGFPENR